VTTFRSGSSWYTPYPSFADTLNHAFERLANVQVDGLPEFKAHIVFVPCNREISSDDDDDDLDTSLNLMLLEDACKLHNLDAPKVSQFIDGITESPFCLASFKTVLSLVEIERKKDREDWAHWKYSNTGIGRRSSTRRGTGHRVRLTHLCTNVH